MIKCPHCGSTAQPRRVGITSTSANGRYFVEQYKCGCDCRFEALFPRVEVEEYFIYKALYDNKLTTVENEDNGEA